MEPVPSTADVTVRTYRSFVVRLWKSQPNEWYGEVEHIQSGAHWHFDTLDSTLAFLRRHVESADHEMPSVEE